MGAPRLEMIIMMRAADFYSSQSGISSGSALPVRLLLALALVSCSGGDAGGSTHTPSSSDATPNADDRAVDVAGDAVLQSGQAAAGYLDEIRGTVELDANGTMWFVDELAAALPARPALPATDAALGWSFCVDTDPMVDPVGFPMTGAMPCEFIVHTRWNGKRLSGLFIDRRPLDGGGNARMIPFKPMLEGNSIRMGVAFASLNSPGTFHWSMFSEELGPLGTDIAYHVDEVPDSGISSPILWTLG